MLILIFFDHMVRFIYLKLIALTSYNPRYCSLDQLKTDKPRYKTLFMAHDTGNSYDAHSPQFQTNEYWFNASMLSSGFESERPSIFHVQNIICANPHPVLSQISSGAVGYSLCRFVVACLFSEIVLER